MVSTMNGPIPTHPYYDKSNPNTFVDKPVPRVRPEAKQIATKAMGTVGMLLVEGNRCGSAPMRYSKIYLFFLIFFLHVFAFWIIDASTKVLFCKFMCHIGIIFISLVQNLIFCAECHNFSAF